MHWERQEGDEIVAGDRMVRRGLGCIDEESLDVLTNNVAIFAIVGVGFDLRV
jgi:hypothetical protein